MRDPMNQYDSPEADIPAAEDSPDPRDGHIIDRLFARSEEGLTLLQTRYGKFCHRIALNATMEVAPRAKLGFAHHVVVRHIHSASVSNKSVNHHHLSVVTKKTILKKRKGQAVELLNLDTTAMK